MFAKRTARLAVVVFAFNALVFGAIQPASAKNSVSLGNGVKCTWVLVSAVGANYTYKQVCRKGV